MTKRVLKVVAALALAVVLASCEDGMTEQQQLDCTSEATSGWQQRECLMGE